ncbi:MAG: hypothetical protein ETSY2_26245 [Candidatus Entotheonella gemina]|uniref:Uncharacterized protein n=1 Tax=Candidatus Entotheonella gemina TaxID=1429439 RepID=W4M5I7_9BACT|nr:MAG: hypothetical protein ETSY2_26245 [Candidatus Entotheonella gemina]
MSREFVFNDLSTRSIAPTVFEARQRMDKMVQSIAALYDTGSTLFTLGDIYRTILANDYLLSQWFSDRDADRESKAFFGRLSTKTALDAALPEAIQDRFQLSEFHIDGERAPALGLAFLLDGLAVSLPSEVLWRQAEIQLNHLWLDENAEEHRDEVTTLNIAELQQAQIVIDKLHERFLQELHEEPRSLWKRRQECFPHLAFGLDVEDRLCGLENAILPQVISKLMVLDGAVRNWRYEKRPEPQLPEVHPESQSTMQRYGDLRRFRDANGRDELFERHAMVGSQYCIHLRIIHASRQIEVGYIGPHLPISSAPT